MRKCGWCNAPIDETQSHCLVCGYKVSEMELLGPPPRIHPWSLPLVIAAILLWIAAPFMAINLWTVEDKPTALQIVLDDVPALGDIEGSDGFLFAMITLIGSVICLVCCLKNKIAAVKWTAGLTLLPMLLPFFLYGEYLAEILGPGFCGIFLLLIVILFLPKKYAQPITQ